VRWSSCASSRRAPVPPLLARRTPTTPGAFRKRGANPGARQDQFADPLRDLPPSRRSHPQRVPPGPTGVDVDARGRALVDVRAEVTPALQKTIRSLGGVITSSSSEHHSIMARVPLLKLEQLAGDSAVRFIEPVARATTNHAK